MTVSIFSLIIHQAKHILTGKFHSVESNNYSVTLLGVLINRRANRKFSEL